MTAQPQKNYRLAAVAVAAVFVVAAIAAYAASAQRVMTTTETITKTSTTTQTVVSTSLVVSTVFSESGASCTGSPQGSPETGTGMFSYTFPLTVNYSGPWTLSYQGYASMGKSNPTDTNGSCIGGGPFALSVTVTGPNTSGLTLCAQAEKLDSSSSTLILRVTGYNETSTPNGSVSYCGGVVP